MIWPDNISFEGLFKKVDEWYEDPNHFMGDPAISAQYALDLIFKTLIDDKERLPYLTEFPESTEQINSIMLDMILQKYSRRYRRYIRKMRKEKTNEPT